MNGLQHFDAHLGKVVAHEDAQQALSQDLTSVVSEAVAAMARRATTMADFILISFYCRAAAKPDIHVCSTSMRFFFRRFIHS
jgi:hypothetical protein